MGRTYKGAVRGGAWDCKQEVELDTAGKGKVEENRLGMIVDIEKELRQPKEGFLRHWGNVGELGGLRAIAITQFT